jgi:hypothetical protein
VADFRSERMPSPEGKGIARRAWDAYANAVTGFWLLWHVEGGFEGLLRLGMSRASIYRRIRLFRKLLGVHPDEYEMPGVKLNLTKYQTTQAAPDREGAPA